MMGDDERVAVNGEHKNWRKPSSINVKKIHANRLFETVSLSLSIFFYFFQAFVFCFMCAHFVFFAASRMKQKKIHYPIH